MYNTALFEKNDFLAFIIDCVKQKVLVAKM